MPQYRQPPVSLGIIAYYFDKSKHVCLRDLNKQTITQYLISRASLSLRPPSRNRGVIINLFCPMADRARHDKPRDVPI